MILQRLHCPTLPPNASLGVGDMSEKNVESSEMSEPASEAAGILSEMVDAVQKDAEEDVSESLSESHMLRLRMAERTYCIQLTRTEISVSAGNLT